MRSVPVNVGAWFSEDERGGMPLLSVAAAGGCYEK